MGLIKKLSGFAARCLKRAFYCSHVCYLEDLVRIADNKVQCRCFHCDKILVAEYGLALNCKWKRRKMVGAVGNDPTTFSSPN